MTPKLMKTPRSLDLEITDKCNLRCKYCSHFSSANNVNVDLPLAEWLQFFEELNRCAVLNVCLSGGEPFIRSDLKEIITGIVKNRMRFKIVSNATLIDDDIAAFISATKRCDTVQVSIDGSIPTTHDACRGDGSFSKALNGLKILQKYKIPVTVRVTIHRQNVHDLENIAKLLLEDIGLPSFSTNSASFMGLCRKNSEQVQLTSADRYTAMVKLLELNKKYNNRINAAAGPLAEARHWLAIEKAQRDGKASLPNRGCLTGCGGAFNKLVVRADGVIVPCSQVSHIELGRINQDSLQDIWQNSPKLNKFRERRNIPLSSFTYCKDCKYINYCTGSCPALAYTIFGNDEHPAPDACYKRFLEQGGKLPPEEMLT